MVTVVCACGGGQVNGTSIKGSVDQAASPESVSLSVTVGDMVEVKGSFVGCPVEVDSKVINDSDFRRVGESVIVTGTWLSDWANSVCRVPSMQVDGAETVSGVAVDGGISKHQFIFGDVIKVSKGTTRLRFVGFDRGSVAALVEALPERSVSGDFDIYNAAAAPASAIALGDRNLQSALLEHNAQQVFPDAPQTQQAMLEYLSYATGTLEEELQKNLLRYRKHAQHQATFQSKGWDSETAALVSFCFEVETKRLGNLSAEDVFFERRRDWLSRFAHLQSGQETTDFAACSRRLGKTLRIIEYHPAVVSLSRTLGVTVEATTVVKSTSGSFRKDDKIVSINNRSVTSEDEAFDALLRVPAGARFTVKYVRGDAHRAAKFRAPKVQGGPFQWYFFADSDK